jgi:uncharacterized hydrophobic protein (TIGR00271 family)
MPQLQHPGKFIKQLFNISLEEEFAVTHAEIINDAKVQGANMWLLIGSMVMACIGLVVDSSMAIIGAMLISPLMGPVVGIGYGAAIGEKRFLRKGVIYWLATLLVCLVISTVYFIAMPHVGTKNQIEAFTHPSIFDVILAFFGGLTMFLGASRVEGAKILAGVAVATSCMPPLCSAGFGVATLQWEYVLGGLYFYIVNSLFIGWGVYLLASLFNYKKFYRQANHQPIKKMMWWLLPITIILLIPSVYMAYKKFTVLKNIQVVESNINNYNQWPISKKNLQQTAKGIYITIQVDSLLPSSDQKQQIEKQLLTHCQLPIQFTWVQTDAFAQKYLQQQIENLQQQVKNLQAKP